MIIFRQSRAIAAFRIRRQRRLRHGRPNRHGGDHRCSELEKTPDFPLRPLAAALVRN
jgi:hypothetical protein